MRTGTLRRKAEAISITPAMTMSGELKKLNVLVAAMTEASARNDGRDLALFQSIRRDVPALNGGAACRSF